MQEHTTDAAAKIGAVSTPRFALLIPVKDSTIAKSRLGVTGDGTRARLMAAFAQDSINAALASEVVDVYVVGDESSLRDTLAGLDVTVLPDEGAGDLNAALRRAGERVGSPQTPTAALLADLPCLVAEDLRTALANVTARGFVPDAQGTGTTLLVAPPGTPLDPRFGAGSARAHLDSGATPIGLDLVSLRLDVDTTDDLANALRFGVGPKTAAIAAQLA